GKTLVENISLSKKAAEMARWKGVVVEGEVGRIGTDASKVYEGKFEIKEEDLTRPQDMADYMKQVRVSVLAVSVGTFHGLDISGVSPNLKLGRLGELGKVSSVGFVLHGGSGTPNEDVQKAIQLGVVKININTETRVAFAGALKKALEAGNEITPYKYLQEPINAVQRVIEEKIRLFGSAGKA
ncbi:class II fructose-bisphosphate aldolase, partial [Candidatus Parcubacteria bacterium]|nr:class II fructose-bisphosphate aldolase [Candidatus Parcubacteria bacterium]